MKKVFFLFLFFPYIQSSAFEPFAEASLGVNLLTDIKEGSRSESGVGTNLNGKGGLFYGPFFGGLDLNFSVINPGDTYFDKVEENSFGLVGGIEVANFSRVYFSFYPYSKATHEAGEYEGMGYKFGAAFYMPFLPFANFLVELRNSTYDEKKVGGTFRGTPELEVTSLSFSFGFFFR